MKFENGLPADASSQEKLLRWAFDLNCAIIETRSGIGGLGDGSELEHNVADAMTGLYGQGRHGLTHAEVDNALSDTRAAAGFAVCERYANGYGRHALIEDGNL